MAKQESTSSVSPLLNSALIPTTVNPLVSSPMKTYQKMQGSSSHSLTPLPPFSSSLLCPPPASSFTSPPLHSSLRPLNSPFCSLPSLPSAGGRKGRVCCGVCGKSFYDKGRNFSVAFEGSACRLVPLLSVSIWTSPSRSSILLLSIQER